MIKVNLIIQQWQGILGYEIKPIQELPELPENILEQLVNAGLNMYIQQYLIPTVYHPINRSKSKAYIIYRVNPHTRQQPLYLTTEDKTLYELTINFDYLGQFPQ